MPYCQRKWILASGQVAAKQSQLKLRIAPHGEAPRQPPPAKPVNVDNEKLNQFKQYLQAQVAQLKSAKSATPIKDADNFLEYVIQRDEVIFEGKYSNIHACFNAQMVDKTLMCRVYQPSAMIVPENDLSLKVLRHIGDKCPDIIQTMDIFVDESRHIYLFQEYANKGNAYEYIRKGAHVSEKEVCAWGKSIYKAMDYLGTIGVCHRSIQPKHMLLKSDDNGQVVAKLTSFRDAVIYWDPNSGDIINQPCKSLNKRIYNCFQAPEAFGQEGEFYNPVDAEVWSLGCTLFFLSARVLPYNVQNPEFNLDAAIHKAVSGAKLSDDAKKCFAGMMQAHTEHRTSFDEIPNEPYFQSA